MPLSWSPFTSTCLIRRDVLGLPSGLQLLPDSESDAVDAAIAFLSDRDTAPPHHSGGNSSIPRGGRPGGSSSLRRGGEGGTRDTGGILGKSREAILNKSIFSSKYRISPGAGEERRPSAAAGISGAVGPGGGPGAGPGAEVGFVTGMGSGLASVGSVGARKRESRADGSHPAGLTLVNPQALLRKGSAAHLASWSIDSGGLGDRSLSGGKSPAVETSRRLVEDNTTGSAMDVVQGSTAGRAVGGGQDRSAECAATGGPDPAAPSATPTASGPPVVGAAALAAAAALRKHQKKVSLAAAAQKVLPPGHGTYIAPGGSAWGNGRSVCGQKSMQSGSLSGSGSSVGTALASGKRPSLKDKAELLAKRQRLGGLQLQLGDMR